MLKGGKKYRITVEDESSLEKRLNFSARFTVLILLFIVFIIVAGAVGIFVFASTPLKNHLPGYLKESERTATEEQHLRLDSLARVYEINETYIKGILSALNPKEEAIDTSRQHRRYPLSLDSLKPASEEEKEFMEFIRERDKYNIVNSSPAVAQSMMFSNLNKGAIVSDQTKDSYQAEIILPYGANVGAVAEGKVISVASSPKASGAYEVIIQHPKGFLSKTSRLSTLFVKPGDRVAAGQIIASGSSAHGAKSQYIIFQLWHDGDPLIPARYLPTVSNDKTQNKGTTVKQQDPLDNR